MSFTHSSNLDMAADLHVLSPFRTTYTWYVSSLRPPFHAFLIGP